MGEVATRSALRIQPATRDDISEIVRILADGAERMESLGEVSAWPVPFPSSRIEPYIDANCVFLAVLEGVGPVGTFMLTWNDDPYWDSPKVPAGYLHRMAVLRQYSGRGVSAHVIHWVFDTVMARGRRCVRLDCLRSADRLRRHYESFGFRYVRNAEFRGTLLALYERQLLG